MESEALNAEDQAHSPKPSGRVLSVGMGALPTSDEPLDERLRLQLALGGEVMLAQLAPRTGGSSDSHGARLVADAEGDVTSAQRAAATATLPTREPDGPLGDVGGATPENP